MFTYLLAQTGRSPSFAWRGPAVCPSVSTLRRATTAQPRGPGRAGEAVKGQSPVWTGWPKMACRQTVTDSILLHFLSSSPEPRAARAFIPTPPPVPTPNQPYGFCEREVVGTQELWAGLSRRELTVFCFHCSQQMVP